MTLDDVKKLCDIELNSKPGELTYVDGTSQNWQWENRIKLVKECEDNIHIPKDINAGKVIDDCFYMHNGIKIIPNSYYGYCMLRMLMENGGVHEPQEERAFSEILNYIEPNTVMLELGSYWGFYSMWFQQKTKGKNILVEPNKENIEFGKKNFQINNMDGSFYQFFVDSYNNNNKITVDKIFELEKLNRVSICHSDIQGYELEMLKGSLNNLDKIDYFFISTHSNHIHHQCINFLKKNNFKILCSVDMNESYSYDGLIVAKSNLINTGPNLLEVSKRK
jgi:hypothetical protein